MHLPQLREIDLTQFQTIVLKQYLALSQTLMIQTRVILQMSLHLRRKLEVQPQADDLRDVGFEGTD